MQAQEEEHGRDTTVWRQKSRGKLGLGCLDLGMSLPSTGGFEPGLCSGSVWQPG